VRNCARDIVKHVCGLIEYEEAWRSSPVAARAPSRPWELHAKWRETTRRIPFCDAAQRILKDEAASLLGARAARTKICLERIGLQQLVRLCRAALM
jgi:hypothetical protein